MTALELAAQTLMTEDEAKMILDKLHNMALWSPEMIIELSTCGFRAFEITDYLDNDPVFLLTYLAVHSS
jgi:hypothetical protein